jgi:4Fe-4S ferredoxin
MAFALHVNMDRYHGRHNRVVACPVDALDLFTADPAMTGKIYRARHGRSAVPGFKQGLCAGSGERVEACPHDAIRLAGRGAVPGEAKV